MNTFKDKGELLDDFGDYRIITCPKCSKPIDFYNLKIVCIHCGYSKEFKHMNFWFPLARLTVPIKNYLEIDCCNKLLWAYNLEHLNFIERYVEAELRKRESNINKSLTSRLPQWIKSNKNRSDILKCIKRLKLKLQENNYTKNLNNNAPKV